MKGDAHQAAKQGGKHANWYKDQVKLGKNQLRKGIQSLTILCAQHYDWITNPQCKVEDWNQKDERYKAGLIKKWQRDIARQSEQLDILQGILEDRSNERIQSVQGSSDWSD